MSTLKNITKETKRFIQLNKYKNTIFSTIPKKSRSSRWGKSYGEIRNITSGHGISCKKSASFFNELNCTQKYLFIDVRFKGVVTIQQQVSIINNLNIGVLK